MILDIYDDEPSLEELEVIMRRITEGAGCNCVPRSILVRRHRATGMFVGYVVEHENSCKSLWLDKARWN